MINLQRKAVNQVDATRFIRAEVNYFTRSRVVNPP